MTQSYHENKTWIAHKIEYRCINIDALRQAKNNTLNENLRQWTLEWTLEWTRKQTRTTITNQNNNLHHSRHFTRIWQNMGLVWSTNKNKNKTQLPQNSIITWTVFPQQQDNTNIINKNHSSKHIQGIAPPHRTNTKLFRAHFKISWSL